MKNLTNGEKLLRIKNSRNDAIEEIEFLANHIRLEKMVAETIFVSKSEYEAKILRYAKEIANLVEVINELDELKK